MSGGGRRAPGQRDGPVPGAAGNVLAAPTGRIDGISHTTYEGRVMLKKDFGDTQRQGLELKIGDRTVIADPKVFSTGSVGFYLNAKVPVTLADGSQVMLQLGGNFIVANSKELPADADLTTGKVAEKGDGKTDAKAGANGKAKVGAA